VRRPAAWLVPALWLAAGCGDVLEVQYDPVANVRPSTLVRRLQQDVANFKSAWEPQRRGGYGPVDFQIGELAEAANAMAEDLQTQRGRFPNELEKARVAGASIVQQLARGTSRPVQEGWRPLRDTLNTLLTEYRGKAAASVYAVEARATRTLVPARPPEDDYDASFKIEQVRKRFETVMKSWRGSAARRTDAPWTRALEGELAGFSTGLGDLLKVKSGTRGEVVPVARRLMVRADLVGAIVRDHAGELPPPLVEDWTVANGWLRMLSE
jgi:hypothetical protein